VSSRELVGLSLRAVFLLGSGRQNFSRVKICWPPHYNPGSRLRRAGEGYNAKLFRRFSCRARTRDVSGLSSRLAVIGDFSRDCFVQFDCGAHLL
jgi:hypothetical protein